MAVKQSASMWLTDCNREQAHSYRGSSADLMTAFNF
jgi:hypothetical protein